MSNVNLSIGSRSFAVACADGEEAHVTGLGRLIDEKVAAAGAQGQTETRMLLFAALLLADEVHELRNGGGGGPALPDGFTDRLAQVAGRIENIANLLESDTTSA
ncbi:cell division protein ZapA [Novosphingobium endophyticum]|uniref:Cell division protein ZapA n=1 Tax=Novosphingobium endophyticum TaxID=1955250 RepID=A0A916TUE5_9SPHN|nr:cell division protein ZapA [Novosphingobium endophyticum]GGB99403.1 cell division protein ZapA [Novosphingobium endophyticum]